MIIARDIHLSFNHQVIFDDISFTINQQDKIALVGKNGSGKTTLLKVLTKHITLDEGSISYNNNYSIGYLSQEFVMQSTKTVYQEALSSFDKWFTLKKELEQLEEQLDNNNNLEKYAHLQDELSLYSNESIELETKTMLTGLGFSSEMCEKKVSELSTGWQMRLCLAKLLLKKSDFYFFDEPTNHLDLMAKEWFLNFLKQAHFGYLLISHDAYFLEHACEKILALNNGSCISFNGRYKRFLQYQEEEKEKQEKAYIAQQKEIKHKKAIIEKFRAKASKAKMAKSMERALDKIDRVAAVENQQHSMNISFGSIERSGSIVLTVKHIDKSFETSLLFKDVNFEIKRGEKVAIIAANGKGKSTLLNIITNNVAGDNDKQEIIFGHNVTYSFFKQDQGKVLDSNKTVLEEVESSCTSSEQRKKVRSMLGAFLFSGDDTAKKIGVLSGGEKNRVAMVKILLDSSNFLILDEPTNHLDIESKDVLLNALKQYPGTVLFVSHDRDFLDALANETIILNDKKVTKYSGNYSNYLDYQKYLDKTNNIHNTTDKKIEEKKIDLEEKNQKDFLYQKELKKLEKKINYFEEEENKIVEKFTKLSGETESLYSLEKKHNDIKKKLADLYVQWEKLTSKLDF